MPKKNSIVAYFSLEIAIDDRFKSYSGGLGVLAGDILKSAADMGIDMVGVTILYKKGYFKQVLDPKTGEQIEKPDIWDYEDLLTLEDTTFEYTFGKKTVLGQVWRYDQVGRHGHVVPIYFLDVDLPENDLEERYTDWNLYSGYEETRVRQEVCLGIGGVIALGNLGYNVKKYHLNESHAAFGVFAILEKLHKKYDNPDKIKQEIHKKLVFTTHTPVKHGHRGYTIEQYHQYLHPKYHHLLDSSLVQADKKLLLTSILLETAGYTNAVAKKHMDVTKEMFPGYQIDFVTNGIDHNHWVSNSMGKLFDQYIPLWRDHPASLRNAMILPDLDFVNAHRQNKFNLFEWISQEYERVFDPQIFTIGFARRTDGYKRPDFILRDLDRLKLIADRFGGLQILFAGKAFPNTKSMEEIISRIYKISMDTSTSLNILYLQDYNMNLSKKLVSGVDLWLNNPIVPLEASGTSGMKAALNGVPNLSTVDGWWAEGWIEGETGWAIGNAVQKTTDELYELDSLYKKLADQILPRYYLDNGRWIRTQKSAIALNASFFNTHRVLKEYILKAYK